MPKQIRISICPPDKQIKSWQILKFKEPNIWFPVAYIRQSKGKDKDFNLIMKFIANNK